MLKSVINYFIPLQISDNHDFQQQQRMVVYTVFITATLSFFLAGVSWLSDFEKGMQIMLAACICHVGTLFLLKSGLNAIKAANLFGLVGVVSIYGCAFYSGGHHSPFLPWLSVVPIVVLLLTNKKSGFFWAIVSVVIIFSFGLMDHYRFLFANQYDTASDSFLFVNSYAVLVLITFLTYYVFANVQTTAFTRANQQKEELAIALSDLKETQTQLIHSEKMASLGELTAGIAHEIQNPLNFVNNFSELGLELAGEMESELGLGNYDEAAKLSAMLTENLRKIADNGIRASGIVKDMLQHSRKTDANKEPEDINKLTEEYLRLCFHMWRAKDKNLIVSIKTNLDENIKLIDIIKQDIGPVLLNIYNNAFYAMNEKKNRGHGPYQPAITVATQNTPNAVRITIKDNGIGIGPEVLENMFQPFFTTKPIGQGSGLGLSISYEIITKGHGGQLKVKTEQDLYTEITITLPKVLKDPINNILV